MKKDLRAGFAQIDKTYAYAKVDTKLNVRESGSTLSLIHIWIVYDFVILKRSDGKGSGRESECLPD